MSLISDIKLIRTDTTLDLSRKAEKGITPFPLKWEILLILGIFAVFEKYIF
jgi:hypothetical protein